MRHALAGPEGGSAESERSPRGLPPLTIWRTIVPVLSASIQSETPNPHSFSVRWVIESSTVALLALGRGASWLEKGCKVILWQNDGDLCKSTNTFTLSCTVSHSSF